MSVRLQEGLFDIAAEVSAVKRGRLDIGAIVTFTGVCREEVADERIVSMTLDHYPEMAQAELERIEAEARRRWPLDDVTIIHRHGRIVPGEDIVLVVAASKHRHAAFEAASFIMDFLKTNAPFWKKEEREAGDRWVAARTTDAAAAARWAEAAEPPSAARGLGATER